MEGHEPDKDTDSSFKFVGSSRILQVHVEHSVVVGARSLRTHRAMNRPSHQRSNGMSDRRASFGVLYMILRDIMRSDI